MLDAAVPGAVFTSPIPDQILAATRAVDGGAGVLHMVKNYTGDVLNFQMAAELARDDGIRVVTVVIADDVAVENSLYTAGRRGTGATVFVEKIAGRSPRRRRPGRRGRGGARGERPGPVLRRGAQLLHGAPGGQADLRARRGRDGARHRHPRRARPDPAARPGPRAGRLRADAILADLPFDGDLLAIVNGMGGTPLIELYLMFHEVRIPGGPRRTRRQQPGGQLHHQPGDAGLLGDGLPAYRDASPALGRTGGHARPAVGTLGPAIPTVYQGAIMDAEVFRAWIVSAAGVIEANRDHLTQLDAAIGDADHGINLARGFTAVPARRYGGSSRPRCPGPSRP